MTSGFSASPLPDAGLDPLVGKVLDGRFRLTAHLATGGMASVYRGHDGERRVDVAVKVMRPDLVSAPDLVERFRREAEIMRRIDHENVVRVVDLGRSREGLVYLVMELLSGESLFDRIRREGFLPPDEVIPVLVQVCAGLEASHALGVVHRDLKPENVFLARTASGGEIAKVLDFGIAKFPIATDVVKTAAGVVVGTPEYLSPEQATGAPVDGRADLYAVGLIAWRALVGRHPFHDVEYRGLVQAQADQRVPRLCEARADLAAWPALEEVVARTCAKRPEERPGDARELGRLLGDALERPLDVPAAAPPGPPAEDLVPGGPLRPTPPEAPGPALRLAAIGVGAVLLVVLAVTLLSGRDGPDAEVRSRLAAHAPRAALDAADGALAKAPDDPVLHGLRGRALLELKGREGEGLAAIALAAARGPLEPDVVAAVEASLAEGGGLARLLGGSDCDARRAAARRLGALHLEAARPILRAVMADEREHGGDACGAPEAIEALDKLDAPPAPPPPAK
ncbi:MAG: serine/threonine-protein kinase [Anaeromyxobacteraceae bacterium]